MYYFLIEYNRFISDSFKLSKKLKIECHSLETAIFSFDANQLPPIRRVVW